MSQYFKGENIKISTVTDVLKLRHSFATKSQFIFVNHFTMFYNKTLRFNAETQLMFIYLFIY